MASSQNASKVSFTIRRPTPAEDADFKIPALPRHLTDEITPLGSPLASSPASPAPDSSDEEDEALQDELVSGFDKFGVQRLNEKKKAKQGPLVIPALKNRDWREQARKRRSASQFVPVSATAKTGADGSVGGLGTRDSINSGPTLSGLQVKQREVKLEQGEDQEMLTVEDEDIKMEEEPETEDQRALRAILAESNGEIQDGPTVDIIPISETDALKQDVEELPDSATMDDYARVPVSQFGAALLRGMGWKEGTAASRKPGKGLIEPYLPTARPALLGIGAKEQEVYDDGSKKKKGGGRPERRYVPVIKKEREGSGTPGSSSGRGGDRSRSPTRRTSAPVSRRSSRSPDTTERNRDLDDRKRESGRGDRDYGRERERNRDRDRDYDSGRDRRDRDRGSDRYGERDRGYEKEKERDRGFDRDRRRGDDASRSDGHRERARDSDKKRRNH